MKRKKRTVAGIAGVCISLLLFGFMAAGRTAEAKKVDVDGVYHAALGLQTEETSSNGRIYRKGYYTNSYYGKEEWNHLAIGEYGDENSYERLVGKFKDVTIKGNGVYTVSLNNADFRDATQFQLLQVATDIPNTGKIKFSDMKVEINGEEVASVSRPVLDDRKVARGNACLQVVNTELRELDVMDRNLLPDGRGNTIKITFRVKGFSYKKGDTPPVSVTPTPVPTQRITPTPQPTQAAASPSAKKKQDSAKKDKKAETKRQQENVMPDEYETPAILLIIVLAVVSIIWITVTVNQRRR